MTDEERKRIEERIADLENRVRTSQHLAADTREGLLRLLNDLKRELGTRLAMSAKAGAATSPQASSRVADHRSIRGALDELANSVEEFEESHPALVDVVNRIATTLSGLGI